MPSKRCATSANRSENCCPIRLADGAYLEVVRPSVQRAVHLAHQLCGFLPCPRSVRQCMDLLNHALDALLRWPVTQAHLAGSRRIQSSERVAQEVELSFRDLADSCLLLVDRELQLSHDLAQLLQCLIGIACQGVAGSPSCLPPTLQRCEAR